MVKKAVVSAGLTVLILLIGAAKRKKVQVMLILSAAVFAALMAVTFSLAGISPSSGLHWNIRLEEINLIPFVSIGGMIASGINWYTATNLLGNILMFAPLGFFIPLLCQKARKCSIVLLTGCGVSLLIECTQLFLIRGTDIDDLILNTLGAGIGYLCWLVFEKILPDSWKNASWFQQLGDGTVALFVSVAMAYLVNLVIGGWELYQFYLA